MGPDRVQGHAGEHRFVHERPAAGYGGVHRREAHRYPGPGVDSVRMRRDFTRALGKGSRNADLCFGRCNNILWMGDANGVEMTDLGLK